MTAPSGEQIEISLGDAHAVVVEVGGGLRTYQVGDRELLFGYAADAMCTSGRGQVLVPWPNRIEDGSYEFAGRHHQLALTEPAARNAIHGLVRWSAWSVGEREQHRVVLEHLLHPRPGYPFSLALGVEYLLSDEGLQVRTHATNVGPDPCPYGCGAHPYLRVGTEVVDEATLHLPARTVLEPDERGIPRSSVPVERSPYDFTARRPIGSTTLDHCFTDLEREADDRTTVTLLNPADGTGVALWVDASHPYLMVFTGDPVPDLRRRCLAVEPMTCAPNAFRSGDGLITLEPGRSIATTWGIVAVGG